jgi:hypothetical protein
LEAVITLLPGDGIGPDVTDCALEVLEAVAARYGHDFKVDTQLIGGAAIDRAGSVSGSASSSEPLDISSLCDGFFSFGSFLLKVGLLDRPVGVICQKQNKIFSI